MGTLTADCPRLDTHCPHKLATSCRLTSTPNCCACADERPHSRTYRVYIDGVGFVQRGTRWQGYCWFCKEFWNNRLAATDPPLETTQTQIPHIPDQTEFLERWFEFHQGYRIVKDADGAEQRIAVLGENLNDVSPGFLPRTLDQLRRRTANDARRAENRFQRRRLSSEDEQPEQPLQSIEDALDSLLDLASDEEEELGEEPLGQEEVQQGPLSRAETVAQRGREQFARLYGTREEIEQDDYESPIANMYGRAYQRFRQAEEVRASGDMHPDRQEEMEQHVFWDAIQTLQRSLPPEPPQDQSEQPNEDSATFRGYDSALQGQSGADVRAEFEVDSASMRQAFPNGTPLLPLLEQHITDLQRRFARLQASGPVDPDLQQRLESEFGTLVDEWVRVVDSESSGPEITFQYPLRQGHLTPAPGPELDMDKQDRPPPLEDEQMTKVIACRVCYCQVADVALIPCGHMALCQWCADTMIPVKHTHIPIKPSKCPVCRKGVKQRYKIHM